MLDAEPLVTLQAGASGYAGGFLARDWFGGSMAALGALSFDLHAQLALKHEGETTWGYRRMDSVGARARMRKPESAQAPKPPPDPLLSHSRVHPAPIDRAESSISAWLDRTEHCDVLGTPETTAQIEPYDFTLALYDVARRSGLRFIRGEPERIERRDGEVTAVVVRKVKRPASLPRTVGADNDHDDTAELTLPCATVVLAAGPWTGRLAAKLGVGDLPVGHRPGHSLIMRPKVDLPPTAFFASIYGIPRAELATITQTSEAFPRPDGTVRTTARAS